MLGGPFLRLGIPKERLIPQGSGCSAKDTGRLVTCECPLRTDSASWKSLASFIQLISSCNSCILPVEPWNRMNSSNSLRLFLMSFTKIPVLLQKLFMEKLLILSKLFVSLMSTTNIFFLWLDRFIQLLNTSSAWNSCFRISAWQSARICSLCRSRRTLICSFSDLLFWVSWALDTSRKTTGLTVLPWLTDDDRQDDRPSSSKWSARLRHASRSVWPMVTSS